jgi:hypothetical protein
MMKQVLHLKKGDKFRLDNVVYKANRVDHYTDQMIKGTFNPLLGNAIVETMTGTQLTMPISAMIETL